MAMAPQDPEQPVESRMRGGRSSQETLLRVGEGKAWGDQLQNKGPNILCIGVINVNGLEAYKGGVKDDLFFDMVKETGLDIVGFSKTNVHWQAVPTEHRPQE
jgi:hypothetical protein